MSPHIRENKTVLYSGFHAVDSGFQSPGSRIPRSKFPRFQIQQAKQFPEFLIWIPLYGASLGLQANPFTVFFLSKMRTIIREHSQIISSSSRWARKVELCYTYIIMQVLFLHYMLTCISQDGIDQYSEIETEDSTI